MRIIFVCTGNTCRSPMAEGIAKSVMPEHDIASRGIMAHQQQPLAQNTQRLLRQNGYPQKEHSEHLTEKDVNADIILTMTPDHTHLIRSIYGNDVNVQTLTSFVGSNGYVKDPFGGSIAVYEETFKQLKDLVLKLKDQIPEA
ncbi:low molecular weight phosphatase family protein [Staphylococcus felis]|uniref:low molecular weight protein arginine phosphatase n=1 Tax=Staphylococcus felis TaxID=46127 RepID=UPI000E21E9B6|nr:low molecular weight protein arginine phosphatase [Staphylococcus felis]REH90800.1 low molecular weight phosphatase family protein [Staphylococcus felis]